MQCSQNVDAMLMKGIQQLSWNKPVEYTWQIVDHTSVLQQIL